ncbi:MAG: hypothetical protein JW774_07805 [Candidatus Aureabacteria bacterium]|nr:hypothetical protein [Candidatus Auribacterota bacterium]
MGPFSSEMPPQRKTDRSFIKWFADRYLVITRTEQRILAVLCALFFLGIIMLMISYQEEAIKNKSAKLLIEK